VEINVSSFYKFVPIGAADLGAIKRALEESASHNGIRGLILLSEEGYNASIAGLEQALNAFFKDFSSILDASDLLIKENVCAKEPFRRFTVDLRKEIITFLGNHLDKTLPETYLSPEEWHKEISGDPEALIIDTRNWYETKLGAFKNALNPEIKTFSEFPEWVEAQSLAKDKKLLLYCTGGVRCEKAVVDLKGRGYTNVWQLHGGILNYLKEFPEGGYEGECFVFDHRVSVDKNLKPSQRYSLCPLCGDPAETPVTCKLCETDAILCASCLEKLPAAVCSKNCRHHIYRIEK
jgi:UPF0176 protein